MESEPGYYVKGFKFVFIQPCPDLPRASAPPEELAAYERWTKANEMTRCYILASIDGVLQQQHLPMPTTRNMMLNLKEMFGKQECSARQDVMRNLLNIKMAEGTPAAEGIIKSKKYVLMVFARGSSELKLKGKKVMKKNKAKHVNKGETKPRGVQIRDLTKGKCFHYGKDGHWKRNCPTFIASKKQGMIESLVAETCFVA
ncbi:hypothetical protein Acr_00g0077790 [Actinidia rufa]|uniref:Gag/pol protein n=1 Tax=Actinidia rufa TaxID=165716 RepID=A0A7J0DTC1_9ERIC|nr:hypothetical protein Acr_00g0077790 [Actinidia rufa]